MRLVGPRVMRGSPRGGPGSADSSQRGSSHTDGTCAGAPGLGDWRAMIRSGEAPGSAPPRSRMVRPRNAITRNDRSPQPDKLERGR
jgi:hypothetical protein